MKYVLHYYKKFIPLIVLIAAFLFGQAMCELALPGYMSEIINNGIVKSDLSYVKSMGLIMIVVSAGSMVCAIGGSFFAAFSAAKISRNIRSALFHKVTAFSAAEMNRFSTASLITSSTNLCMRAGQVDGRPAGMKQPEIFARLQAAVYDEYFAETAP